MCGLPGECLWQPARNFYRQVMATGKREQVWLDKYGQLKAYIEEHHHLPDKRRVEKRALLNWWKYNRKLILQGKQDNQHMRMLDELSRMRDS